VKYWRKDLSNIGDAEIGEGCTIHSHVWISDGVKIGRDCKIQAFVFIPKGVTINDRVFLGPGTTFSNDKHPPSPTISETVVEDDVSIGANATIVCGVRLGKGCKVGAGSVVTKDIPPGETWVGNPAKRLRHKIPKKTLTDF
jgi:acetyltransferase-like isoleucine patch superfamily enzyme